MSEETFWRYFHEIYEGIPRQGPGERASTERALRLLPPLTQRHRILDIGCGAGAQTIDLARATAAQIVAIDKHAPFVSRLVARAAELGLGDRITAQVGDMTDLRFPDQSFDVIWSEGAIFVIGFAQGLAAWRRLLTPGGYLVVSDFCWLRANPPRELQEMLLGEATEVGDAADRRRAIATSGYRAIGEFVLPAAAWWDNYYVPLADSLSRFRAAHAGNPEALEVADRSQREIDLYRKYPDYFGYVFFALTLAP